MPERCRLPYTLRGPCAETENMFLAEAPVLPGCRAWGATPEEALRSLDGVASEFVVSYKRHGDELPDNLQECGKVRVSG